MAKKTRRSKFRPDEVIAYIREKGWQHGEKGDNFTIKTCVFCGNTSSNLEIQKDRGYFKCWSCGESGSFYDLRKAQGDVTFEARKGLDDSDGTAPKRLSREAAIEIDDLAQAYHNRIQQRPAALEYLRGRGFTDETIYHFKFGCQKKSGTMWLTIPHISEGIAVNLKYRSIPPADKAWRQEENSEKVLYNCDAIAQYDELILTEGELKTAALWQMGFKNCIGLTGGVDNFQPAWVDQLEKATKIWLVLDSDAPGQKGAEKLAMRLGPERCYNIVLRDAKDPDEWFFQRGHTAVEFQRLLDTAKRVDVRNIVSLGKALAMLEEDILLQDDDSVEGLQTQWPEVNRLIKGFHPGDLIVLSAPPKIGKTTLALNWVLYQARLGNPTMLFCMEMNAKRLSRKVVCWSQNIEDDFIDADYVSHARADVSRLPVYFANTVKRGIDHDELFEDLKMAVRRYGLKSLVFDNIHFLVRASQNLREAIGEVSQGFKLLAEETQIPVILIAHPRKLNKNRVMTADDLKESGSIHADADQIILMHRERKLQETGSDDDYDPDALDSEDKEPPLSPITSVIVDASRYAEGGRTQLYYEGAKSRFQSMRERRP